MWLLGVGLSVEQQGGGDSSGGVVVADAVGLCAALVWFVTGAKAVACGWWCVVAGVVEFEQDAELLVVAIDVIDGFSGEAGGRFVAVVTAEGDDDEVVGAEPGWASPEVG